MIRPEKWTPSWIAWALGTFGFVIAAVFLTRIYIVWQYREHSGVLQEETLRVGILIDRHLQEVIADVDSWREKQPRLRPGYQPLRYGPPVSGAKALRIWEGTAPRAQWIAQGFENPSIPVEAIIARDAGTRFANVSDDIVALSWTAKDGLKIVFVYEKAALAMAFEVDPALKDRVVLLLMNSMNQLLLQSDRRLNADYFRGNVQYQYDGRGVVQIQDLGHDVLGFLSIPTARGLVLMSKISRR